MGYKLLIDDLLVEPKAEPKAGPGGVAADIVRFTVICCALRWVAVIKA